MQRSRTDERLDPAGVPREPVGASAGYEVGVVGTVRALHAMAGDPGPEGRLHPHDYRVEVMAGAASLDERGMVVDIDVLERALTDLLDRIRDRDLGPIVPNAPSVTVEVLAAWIHRRLAPVVAGEGAGSLLVRVWEHPQAFGAYRADPHP